MIQVSGDKQINTRSDPTFARLMIVQSQAWRTIKVQNIERSTYKTWNQRFYTLPKEDKKIDPTG
jgi:hypothetical protein